MTGSLISGVSTMLAAVLASGSAPHANTATGIVKGQSEDGVEIFRGIPYAAPPIGEWRWRAPQPPERWTGVRDASIFGPPCIQAKARQEPERGLYAVPQSEDCLTLNVWTPARSHRDAPLPVMVWIHGGSFRYGAGSLPTYDGTSLARRGVVVVTINYRLGLFGTFAHPVLARGDEPGGNWGLLDAIAALRWVQANAAAFGGDKTRVTLMGESAGAVSVGYLMASPLAHGLFARAIMQSGGLSLPEYTREKAQGVARQIAEGLGASNAVSLRALPAGQLRDARVEAADTMPFIDGVVVKEKARAAFEHGHAAAIPLMIGSNDAEAGFFGPNYWHGLRGEVGPDTWTRLSALTTGYGRTGMDAAAEQIASERFAGVNSRAIARASSGRAPTWAYRFAWVPPAQRAVARGAIHTAEIPYVFGHIAGQAQTDAASRALSARLADRWVAFARDGSPELADGDWPRVLAGGPEPLLLIDTEGERIGANPVNPLLDALEAVALPPSP